jgi:hypothetical protein
VELGIELFSNLKLAASYDHHELNQSEIRNKGRRQQNSPNHSSSRTVDRSIDRSIPSVYSTLYSIGRVRYNTKTEFCNTAAATATATAAAAAASKAMELLSSSLSGSATTKTGIAAPNTTMILESGFSLSEQAHHDGDEHLVVPTSTSTSNNSNNSNNNSTTSGSVPSSTATNKTTATTASSLSMEDLRQQVVDDVVGCCSSSNDTQSTATTVTSPLEFQSGQPVTLPLVYCDFTASHRPLQSIETYLTQKCLPTYGNTHTNTSLTGSQSTAFVSEARQIVAEACGAKTTGKASQDVVLFA